MAGRTQMYLTAISGTVVALALAAQGTGFGPQFIWFALGLLPPLLFIGLVTFVRLVYLNLEDARWLQGMNRIRRAYVQAAPAIEAYLVTSSRDDERGLLATYAAQSPGPGWIHGLFTTPGMVSVINGVVGAAILGIGVQTMALPGPAVAVAALAAFLALFVTQWRFQAAVLARGTGLPAAFPHPERSLRDTRSRPSPPRHAPAPWASGVGPFLARKTACDRGPEDNTGDVSVEGGLRRE